MTYRVVPLLGAGVLSPVLAIAAEGEASPFAGDFGVALWTLVIFGIVLVILGKFAWGPILNALQTREDFIHGSLAEAQKDREEAETARAEAKAMLEEARAEAVANVEESRHSAERVKQEIESEAREEAERIIERARRDITLAKEAAVKEIYRTSADIAVDFAARVMRREMTPEDQDRLVTDALSQIEDLEKN